MAETKMQLVDWLDDLTVRFLLNLPPTELSSVPRLCFQVEEAQWFYEDFIRPAAAAAGSPLPSLTLKQFCLLLFQHCPLLSGFTDAQHIAAYDEFLAYKVRVPVRGAIMMDDAMEKVILVKGWKKGASWSFPRGKINKDEKDLDCAIREVDEETGYDLRAAGLVPSDGSHVKSIDVTMKEQQLRMFVFRGVPQNTAFAPKTRKEISKIAWYNLRDLPGFKKAKNNTEAEVSANKFYMVAPFLGHLKKWVAQQKRKDAAAAQSGMSQTEVTEGETTDAMVEEPVAGQHLFDRSTELKHLLSIGGSSNGTSAYATQPPSGPNQNPKDLLAMLRGASTDIQPQNVHQASHDLSSHFTAEDISQSGYNVPSGHFQSHVQPPLASATLNQQQQAQYPSRISYPASSPQAQPMPLSSGLPTPSQNLHAQSQAGRFSGPQLNNFPVGAKSPQLPVSMQHQYRQSNDINAAQDAHAFMPQGLSGQAIATGPIAPKASQLPPTRLTQHSMNLLDAFKGAANPSISTQPTTSNQQFGPGSAHQNTLLGLFRKSPAPQKTMQATGESQAHPQPSHPAEKPKATMERRPTLNEITRTLPMSMTHRRSSASSQVTAINTESRNGDQSTLEIRLSKDRAPEEPTRQQVPFKILQRITSSPGQSPPEASQATDANAVRVNDQLSGDQNQGPSSTSRPRKAGKSPNTARDNNGISSATALHRPSSSRGPKSPAQRLPNSSSRGASPKTVPTFQPQVLKRPKQDLSQDGNIERAALEQQSANKTDHLLALFGKPSTAIDSGRSQPQLESQQPSSSTSGGADRQSHLLSLLSKSPRINSTPVPGHPSLSPPQIPSSAGQSSNAALTPARHAPIHPLSRDHQVAQQPSTHINNAKQDTAVNLEPSGVSIAPEMQVPATLQAPNPPSAPRLSPTTKSIAPRATQAQDRQQQLLNLFTQRHQATSPSSLASPRTPISPFALPTPAQKAANNASGVWQVPTTLAGYPPTETVKAQDAINRGSASNTPTPTNTNFPPVIGHNATAHSGPRGSVSTPVEHKDFLLGFLNGVVQREGAGRKH